MPKAATGRGDKTTAASAVIPKNKPIVRMTLAPYEALKADMSDSEFVRATSLKTGSSERSVPSHHVRAKPRPPDDSRPLLAPARCDAPHPLRPHGLADAYHRDRRESCGQGREPQNDSGASDFPRLWSHFPTGDRDGQGLYVLIP